MKIINMKNLRLFLLMVMSIYMSACSNEMELTGKVHEYDYLGYKCWYVTDKESGFNYEILSPDDFLLKEGASVNLKAEKSDAETICKIGDKLKIISYRLM